MRRRTGDPDGASAGPPAQARSAPPGRDPAAGAGGRNGPLARAQTGAPPRSGGQVAAMSVGAPKLRCTGRMGAVRYASRLPEINFLCRAPIDRDVESELGGPGLPASACTRHASISLASRCLLVFLLFGFPLPSSLSIPRLGPVGLGVHVTCQSSYESCAGELASHARLCCASQG